MTTLKDFVKKPTLETFLTKSPLRIRIPKDGEPGPRGFPGEEGRPGKTPSKTELEALIKPLIPEPKELDITPKEVVEKINKSRGEKIKKSRVEGLDEIESLALSAKRNVQNIVSMGGNRQTKLQLNGSIVSTGADTLNFVGGALTPVGDGTTVTYTSSSIRGLSKTFSYNGDGSLNTVTDALGTKTFGYTATVLTSLTGTGAYKNKAFTYNGDGSLAAVVVS